MHCSCQLNLLHYAEIVPTLSTQLNIIASVKAATPNDETVYLIHHPYSLYDKFGDVDEYCIKIPAKTVGIARKYRTLMPLKAVSDEKRLASLSNVLGPSSSRFLFAQKILYSTLIASSKLCYFLYAICYIYFC